MAGPGEPPPEVPALSRRSSAAAGFTMCRTRLAQGMGGRYRGNRQTWFAMRFTGADTDSNLATERPEFDAWEWVRPERLPS